MNVRSLFLSLAAAATLAAGLHHWQARRTQARLEAERTRAAAGVAETRRLHDETSQRIAAARSELEALLAERANRPRPDVAKPAPSAPPPKSTLVAASPELRRLQVQAFVSDQRLRFAALLERVGFSAGQLQQFDAIHAAHQQAMLESAPTDAVRQQARQARDAQLQELFGPAHDDWLEANRHQPARAIVDQIVQQTFQSSGALTTAQADELTRIVAQHRLAPPQGVAPGPARHDWDQIIADARSILADRQMDDFVAAIEFRRASDKMSALAAKRKP